MDLLQRGKQREARLRRRRCKQSCLGKNQGFGPEPFWLIVKCVSAVFPLSAQSLGEQHHNNDCTLFHLHSSFLLSNPSLPDYKGPNYAFKRPLKQRETNKQHCSLASNPQSLIGCDGNPGFGFTKHGGDMQHETMRVTEQPESVRAFKSNLRSGGKYSVSPSHNIMS